jgi:hypothetical protein
MTPHRSTSPERTIPLLPSIAGDPEMPEENWAAHGGVQAVSYLASVDHERGLKNSSAIPVTLERYGCQLAVCFCG